MKKVDEFIFATLRLGKDSVDEIKKINQQPAHALENPFVISVTCTQVPNEYEKGTYVIIWLGSDNDKGKHTEWSQGFKAIGKVISIDRAQKRNDNSTFVVHIGYIFPKSVGRLDLLDEAPDDYSKCASMPIIGPEDRANQTVRIISNNPRSQISALFRAFEKIHNGFFEDMKLAYPELESLLIAMSDHSNKMDKVHESVGKYGGCEHLKFPHNRIIFGAPGTGKSYALESDRKGHFDAHHYERVTFHPAYSYAQFFGGYKPVGQGKDIGYAYVPGPFLRILLKALSRPNENFLLLIEEINRANVAAVFGEAFQLLDRKKGRSEYPVDIGDELTKYIAENYSDAQLDEGKLYLPANFYIWATMNSADQGVSPMDTAFKRRWEFEYLSINEGEEKAVSVAVNLGLSGIENEELLEWNPVRHRINKALEKARVPEDKWLGPFFISLESLQNPERFIKVFKSKVLMYLFEDAAKYVMPEIFGKEYKSYSELLVDFEKRGTAIFKGE